MEHITVFTDGACSGNPGPGGWAAILLFPDRHVRELGGRSEATTNNRMELAAVISALRAAKDLIHPVRIYTDSTYVISGVTSWLAAWKRKGWTTSEGKPVLNRDLWQELDARVQRQQGKLTWHYVRGHSGSPGNERADEIAVAFAQGKPITLHSGPLSAYPHDLLDLPEDVPVPKAVARARQKKAGGFYLSLLDGKLERHATWSQCQARVMGKSGARFKKVSSAEEERAVLRQWRV